MRAKGIGDPWISAGFVALDGEIYLARWQAMADRPTLLRLQSTADLEWFGVTEQNYGRFVTSKEAWERRFRLSVDQLKREDLRPVGRLTATPVSCVPEIAEMLVDELSVSVQVQNTCEDKLHLSLSAVVYDISGGQPIATTGTAKQDLSAGESRQFTLPASGKTGGTFALPLLNTTSDAEQRSLRCIAVDEETCLPVDDLLRKPVEILLQYAEGREVAKVAADFGVEVRRGRLSSALGIYDPTTRTITVGTSLDRNSDWERAAILAHELQHATDHSYGTLILDRSSGSCYAHEEMAFHREAQIWQQLWNDQLPVPRDHIQSFINETSNAARNDPSQLTEEVRRIYHGICR